MKGWRAQGWAAIILALGVTGTLIIFAVAGAVNHRMTPLNTEEASALTTVLGSVIGALAVYLGVRANGNGHPPSPPPPEPPEVTPHEPRAHPGEPRELRAHYAHTIGG